MCISKQIWRFLERFSISPKNLRVCSILIGIYQVVSASLILPRTFMEGDLIKCISLQLVSSFVLFLVLLGLSHAEEMDSILRVDMEREDQEDYITQDMHGPPSNELRFKSAAELAASEFDDFIFAHVCV